MGEGAPRTKREFFDSFWVFRKYTFPGRRDGSENVVSIIRRRESRSLAASCNRARDCSLRDGSSENHSTTAPGSASKSNSSLPKKSASITAAAMTVLPAPVVAVRENCDRDP